MKFYIVVMCIKKYECFIGLFDSKEVAIKFMETRDFPFAISHRQHEELADRNIEHFWMFEESVTNV